MDLPRSEAGVAQQKRRPGIGVKRVQRQRPDIHALGGGFPGDHAVVQARGQPAD